MRIGKLKNYIPLIFSTAGFFALFVLYIFSTTPDDEIDIQLSPRHSSYFDEFGIPSAYNESYISGDGNVMNVRINSRHGVSEPRIVSNPVNPDAMAVVANDFFAEGLATVYVSLDGGIQWKQSGIPLSMIRGDLYYSDPWAEFDLKGNLAYVTVAMRSSEYSRNVIFNLSRDNGLTWMKSPVTVKAFESEDAKFDKPKVTFDEQNNIYVTWLEKTRGNGTVAFSVSLNGGKSFSEEIVVINGGIDYADLFVKNGMMYLVYSEDNSIKIISSNDNGASWSKSTVIAEYSPYDDIVEKQRVIKRSGDKGVRVNSDPQLVLLDGTLHITYSALSDNSEFSDVYYVSGDISGMSFTEPVRVSDNPHSDKFMPAITCKDRTIHILYYSSQNDPENLLTEAFIATSMDNGRSFSCKNISTESFDPHGILVGGSYMGDYISITTSKNGLVGVWTDGRSGNMDLMAGIVGNF